MVLEGDTSFFDNLAFNTVLPWLTTIKALLTHVGKTNKMMHWNRDIKRLKPSLSLSLFLHGLCLGYKDFWRGGF